MMHRCASCGSERLSVFSRFYILCLLCDARSYDEGRTWASPPRPEVTRTVKED